MCIWPPSVVFVRLLYDVPTACTIYSSLNPVRAAHVFIPIDLFWGFFNHYRNVFRFESSLRVRENLLDIYYSNFRVIRIHRHRHADTHTQTDITCACYNGNFRELHTCIGINNKYI